VSQRESQQAGNFDFLRSEWAGIWAAAKQAETYAKADPRTSCFHARRTLELLVRWLYDHDGAFRLPYDTSLNALLADGSFKRNVPQGWRSRRS
jgi:type I restriction enzyme R subunit